MADRALSMEQRVAWGMKHLGFQRGTAETMIAALDGKPVGDVIRD